MADDDNLDLPQAVAVPGKRLRLSSVWIIPVLAALVAVGIAIQRIWGEGPTITVVFRSAQGIEAGKSFIKYKDVNIGQVTAVQLSSDFAKVEVTAKIARSAAGLMVEDAQFWVVRPRITVSEISGLGTLLSGSYIGFEAGRSDAAQRRFTGLEVPQVVSGGLPGREFVLKVSDLGGLSAGSPIYYRRVPVGQVISYDFAADGKMVDLKVFVNSPYYAHVHPETRFWNASGVDVSLTASGVEVRAESLSAVLSGGIAFDTPAFLDNAEPAAAQTIFMLHGDRATAMRQSDAIARRYVLHFAESLQGLAVGAPVMFLGLPAGEVTAVGLTHDPVTLDVHPRVDITLFPERLIARLPVEQQTAAKASAQSLSQARAILRHLVDERGLRAQLSSASLLTGQRYVAMDYFPSAAKTRTDWSREVPELPVVQSTLPEVEEKLVSVLRKLDKMPLEAIGANLKNSLASLDDTLKDTRKLVGRLDADVVPELKTTLEQTNNLLNRVDTEIAPELKTTLEDTRRAVVGAERVMNSAQTMLVGPEAPAQQQLRDTLQEVTRAARAIRGLADALERHPEALIRGRQDTGGK